MDWSLMSYLQTYHKMIWRKWNLYLVTLRGNFLMPHPHPFESWQNVYDLYLVSGFLAKITKHFFETKETHLLQSLGHFRSVSSFVWLGAWHQTAEYFQNLCKCQSLKILCIVSGPQCLFFKFFCRDLRVV